MTRRRRALPPLLLAACTLAAPSSAHLGHAGIGAERFVKLDLGSSPPRLVYTLGFSGAAAAAERARADASHDGEVDAEEAAAHVASLRAAIAGKIAVGTGRTLGDLRTRGLAALELVQETPVGLDRDARAPLAFEWVYRLPAVDGAIRVDDAYERDDLERTDVAIVPPAHRHLTRAGDADGSGVSLELAWIDPARRGRPRSLVAAWDPPPRRWVVPAVAGAVLAAGLAWLRVRRPGQASAPGR